MPPYGQAGEEERRARKRYDEPEKTLTDIHTRLDELQHKR